MHVRRPLHPRPLRPGLHRRDADDVAGRPALQLQRPRPTRGQQLHAMLERYFEEHLQLNPLLATFIGDPRYNDRLPNSIGPEHRAQVRAMNERYLAEARAIDVDEALAGRPHLARDLRARARADACGRALSRPPAAGEPDGRPDHADAGARFRHQCAAVRDDPGLRELAAAPRWPGRLAGPGDRQHARRHRQGRRAAAAGHGEGAAAARGDDRRQGGGQHVLRAGARVSRRRCRPRIASG